MTVLPVDNRIVCSLSAELLPVRDRKDPPYLPKCDFFNLLLIFPQFSFLFFRSLFTLPCFIYFFIYFSSLNTYNLFRSPPNGLHSTTIRAVPLIHQLLLLFFYIFLQCGQQHTTITASRHRVKSSHPQKFDPYD